MSYGSARSTREHLVQRAVAVVASVAINAVLSGVLMAIFHSSSSLPWLQRTDTNQALLARCDKGLGSSARRACVAQVVASVQARDAEVQVVARSKESSADRP